MHGVQPVVGVVCIDGAIAVLEVPHLIALVISNKTSHNIVQEIYKCDDISDHAVVCISE
jgi:hypothetical protein